MPDDLPDPAAYAADIDAARDRMIGFVSGCSDAEWHAAPLDGDPRPVAVVVDHVAHAYEYLAGWIRQLAALVCLIALINTYNRMNVITQQPAGDYQPGQWG